MVPSIIWRILFVPLASTVSARCGPHDYLVFYFAGHGTNVTDGDGTAIEYQDEAYVLADATGRSIPPTTQSLMTDDEFSDMLLGSLHTGVILLAISDCCHSGPITGFEKSCWRGRKAVSISGCRDKHAAGDTRNGGTCTHALLMAIESLQRQHKRRYSVWECFREMVKLDEHVFCGQLDISITCSHGWSPHGIFWPLVPIDAYAAPYTHLHAHSTHLTGHQSKDLQYDHADSVHQHRHHLHHHDRSHTLHELGGTTSPSVHYHRSEHHHAFQEPGGSSASHAMVPVLAPQHSHSPSHSHMQTYHQAQLHSQPTYHAHHHNDMYNTAAAHVPITHVSSWIGPPA